MFALLEFMVVHNSDFQPFSSYGICKQTTKILWHTKNIFLPIWYKIRHKFDWFTKNIIVITYSFCSKVTFLKIRCLYLYVWISGTKDWPSDATLLCNMTNKMRLCYMTYIYGSRKSIQTGQLLLCWLLPFFFWQSKGKEVSAPD